MSASHIHRFYMLAKAGKHPAASTGEQTAYRLAAALAEIGDDIALLDGETLAGYLGLVRNLARPWATDAQKDAPYKLLSDIIA